jgi:hypothetical protein
MKPGELREWCVRARGYGIFLVLAIDGVRVDILRKDGTRDGVFKDYLIRNSRVISDT